MTDIQDKIQDIYSLEQLADQNTYIHSLHPFVKLCGALTYIIAVVSFDRYAFGHLVPYIFYPIILMALAEIPYSILLKRVLVALPFCLFAGLSNIIFDRTPKLYVANIAVSGGVLSFCTIMFRTFLCVMAVLILVSTTPFTQLSAQLRRFKVPEILVTIFEMTYRYIGALLLEVSSMYTAYMLRSNRKKGLEMRHMGSFVGQLLLRSFDRAERVYNAMKCRGYTLYNSYHKRKQLTGNDLLFLSVVCGFCLLFRFIDIPSQLTQLINRLIG